MVQHLTASSPRAWPLPCLPEGFLGHCGSWLDCKQKVLEILSVIIPGSNQCMENRSQPRELPSPPFMSGFRSVGHSFSESSVGGQGP